MTAFLAVLGRLRLVDWALLLAAIGWAGQWVVASNLRVQIAVYEARHADAEMRAADAIARAEAAARREEQSRAGAVASVLAAYEKGKDDANAKRDAVAAGIRSGDVRLRSHWQPECPGSVPEAAGTPGRSDAGAELRAASAGRIVGIGAECDAQLRACQSVIRAYTDPASGVQR